MQAKALSTSWSLLLSRSHYLVCLTLFFQNALDFPMIDGQYMNIFYIINGRIPAEKANGYQISQMCQAFEENGSTVELLRPNRRLLPGHEPFRNNLKEFYNLRKSFKVTDIFSVDFQDIFHRLNPFFDRFQFISNLMHTMTFILGLAWYLKDKKKPRDMLYLRDVNILSWLYPFLNSHLKKNIILELHYVPESLARKKRYVRILAKSKALICITNKMKIDMIDLGYPAHKVWVEHDGVDISTFEIKISQEECREILSYPKCDFIVGYVGNFHTNGREKGIDDVIKSASLILKKHPEVKFYFVGGPMDRVPYYESLIKSHSLPVNNFKFFDRRPIKMVPISMKACDLLIIPLPWNEHFAFYMSPMKLFEYMASGQAIIATDVEALKEVLVHGENSLLARHSDQMDFADKVIMAIEDKNLRTRLAEQALVQVKNHTWNIRAKNILDFSSGV